MSYDDWKLATPPEFDTMGERPMCHCGAYMDSHGSVFDTGHTPVLMDEREPDVFDCVPWDATSGMRCIVDGCNCNAVWDAGQTSDGKCPHHKAAA